MNLPIAAAAVPPAGSQPLAVRLPQNPIITPASSPTLGTNINGPSLIRVPEWVRDPLGRYYLYFAHHDGQFIRMAYADSLAGPWTIHEPGVLRLEDAPGCRGHIASPDVHVDEARREILMYFHGPVARQKPTSSWPAAIEYLKRKLTEGPSSRGQASFFATSRNGLQFTADARVIAPDYLRAFQWGGYHYGLSRTGALSRSRDGRSRFETGPRLFQDPALTLRHAAVDLRGDVLRVYYSRIGDRPERILRADVHLTPDWNAWHESAPVTVLEPERDWEGAALPLQVSAAGRAETPLRQLRDPAIYREDDRTWLLYSVAGESGIAIAELKETP